MSYRLCGGEGGCGRMVEESVFQRPSSHAPGCRVRRSVLAKAAAARSREKAIRLAARAAEREARALARRLAQGGAV